MVVEQAQDVFARADLLPERLAEWLRDEIVAGAFPPGGRLVEQVLCARLGVSRVPLREAMRIVAADGLIVLAPHKGAVVTPLSETELQELFGLRIALEGFAVGAAAARQACPALPDLRALVDRMRDALTLREFDAYHALAARFHSTLVAASGNALLTEVYERLKIRFRRYQAAMSRIPDLPEHSIRAHAGILDAVEHGDAVEARLLAEAHLHQLVERYRTQQNLVHREGRPIPST